MNPAIGNVEDVAVSKCTLHRLWSCSVPPFLVNRIPLLEPLHVRLVSQVVGRWNR